MKLNHESIPIAPLAGLLRGIIDTGAMALWAKLPFTRVQYIIENTYALKQIPVIVH
jgi:hypothetical protein